MDEKIKQFLRDESFPSLVIHFTQQISRLEGGGSAEFLLAAGLLCNEMFKGHIYLDLKMYSGNSSLKYFPENKIELLFPQFETWSQQINQSACAGKPGEYKPFIVEQRGEDLYLYLNRYWQYEDQLAAVIKNKVNLSEGHNDYADDHALIERLFPSPASGAEENQQKTASIAALNQPFTVITGGPGTGKTTIVLRILVLLLARHLKQNKGQNYRIRLVAPTGKAAARLKESIRERKAELLQQELISSEIAGYIDEEASTIHRLLGSQPGLVSFAHHKENPLLLDCLVVDEASMVDLALMSKLMDAVPPFAKIILLGDENQLASVEAGSVLRDICLGLRKNEIHRKCVVNLEKSYRFSVDEGIGKLSQLVNLGKGEEAIQLFSQKNGIEKRSIELESGISWMDVPKPTGLISRIEKDYGDHYKLLVGSERIEDAFKLFEQFIILCALRKGPYGVERISRLIENFLKTENIIPNNQEWYHGKPILIFQNDYQLKLFNGDIGIAFRQPGKDVLKVFFKTETGFRGISPFRLTNYESAFAITVHKSQGSEFDQILLLMPPENNQILTRELIYTGITRARNQATIWGKSTVFVESVKRSIERHSGLMDKLN